MNMLDKLPCCLSISLLALAMNTSASAQQSVEPEPQSKQTGDEAGRAPEAKQDDAEQAADIEEILVTGSLIPREANTGISPITVVTSEDMAQQGLMSIGDVMDSLTENSGYTEGKESNLLGRFTTGGQEVNIRGFGTGRTLVLVNGRRIADYPLPFGGEQNGVDVGAIPQASLARVELLSSGASAIYGSDAIGGVLNFITKRDMDQTEVKVTGGMFEQGTGQSVIASIITGNSFQRGSFTLGLDGFLTDQILASDVDHLRKHAPYNVAMVSIQRNTPPAPVQRAVPAGACAPLGFEFTGDVCRSEVSETISLQPQTRQLSGFFDGRFDLTDDIELFGTAMVTDNEYDTRSNILFWNGVVVRDDLASAVFVQRGFSEAELGTSDIEASQQMWTATFGIKGGLAVGADQWHWDLSYSHARYETIQTSVNLKEEGIRDWIMTGADTVIADANQQYTYLVDGAFYDNRLIDNIVRPVAASDIDGLIGRNVMHANSSSGFLTLTLDGTLGRLGFLYEPVKFALRSEIATQSTEIAPDQRSRNRAGEGWYNVGAVESKGDRDRKALALELELPVHAKLDLSLAGRVDHYSDSSSISSRPTGQIKFLYSPSDWLKFRGGYSQTFRAPDMFNLYGESAGFQDVPDFSAPGCFDGEVYVCGFTSIATTRRADSGLSEEHGSDYGFGIIWQPVTNFTATLDWYRITLEDLVVTESAFDLLLREWQCNNGVLQGSSQLCADARSRIARNGFGAVERVIVQPINQDSMQREGLDLRANFSYEFERLGQFSAELSYSKVLKFDLNSFAGDASVDLRYGWQGQSTPENALSATLGWSNPLSAGKGVGVTLYVHRTGGVYNFSQTQFMKPIYDANLTAHYQFSAKGAVSLTLRNLLYTSPQDNGSGFWPYYWPHLQNSGALGRAAFLSLHYSLD
jgi:iron complex outermembrane recepter protein